MGWEGLRSFLKSHQIFPGHISNYQRLMSKLIKTDAVFNPFMHNIPKRLDTL